MQGLILPGTHFVRDSFFQGLFCEGLICEGLFCEGLICAGLICEGLICAGLFQYSAPFDIATTLPFLAQSLSMQEHCVKPIIYAHNQ